MCLVVIMLLIINMWLFFMDRRRLTTVVVVLLFSVDFSIIKLWRQTSGYINGNASSSSSGGRWAVMAQDSSIVDAGINKRGKAIILTYDDKYMVPTQTDSSTQL